VLLGIDHQRARRAERVGMTRAVGRGRHLAAGAAQRQQAQGRPRPLPNSQS
jgi:hypothetical protein